MEKINIDWDSEETHILFNPRDPQPEFELLKELSLKGHLWFTTSGTKGQKKWAALSKQACLFSAHAVNHHFDCTSKDVWLHALPDFHVGGIGIFARAFLSKSLVVDYKRRGKWEAHRFVQLATTASATLTSLVPAQVYDLVSFDLSSPPTLRAAIVGGGRIEPTLFLKALSLGWPLAPSYGLTECASQVATAYPFQSEMRPLSHVEISMEEGLFKIKSPSLLTAYGLISDGKLEQFNPKIDGWFKTEDLGEVKEGIVSVFGRESDFIKIGGESVSLEKLKMMLLRSKNALSLSQDMALVAHPDLRLGHAIHLATTPLSEGALNELVAHFNDQVLPFEKIRKVHFVPKIPRSPLEKILENELLMEIQRTKF